MENEVTQDGNVESSSEAAPVESTVEQAGSSEAPAAPSESTEAPVQDQGDSGEQVEEFVKDEEGNEYIPRDRVEKVVAARLAKMAEQKNAVVNNVLEAIRTDPETRKLVQEALGVPEAATSDQKAEATPESSAFDSFLASHVPAEHHAHYKAMSESLSATIMPHVQALLEQRIGPMLQFIGKQQVQSFASQHPDYEKYSGKIQDMVRNGRAKTLEDAYKIAAWEDKMKGAGAAAIKAEQARKSKLAGTPIRRASGVPGASKPKFGSFKEALRYNAQKHGMDI